MSHSPQGPSPSPNYETAWTAITELIHGDSSWSGHERNVAYLNNGDGTFSDVSGATGLDFLDDSRSYAAADFDGDGDLDLVLKSRNEPGIRVLRNDFATSGDRAGNNSIAVRARGSESNRDAVGALVTVVADGLAATKAISAGSGFLSQHSKELVFGLGGAEHFQEIRIKWPSGNEEVLPGMPVNRRITVIEGSGLAPAEPLPNVTDAHRPSGRPEPLTDLVEPEGIWLIEPVIAPQWTLDDMLGTARSSTEYLGAPLLLNVWATWCPPCRDELRELQQHALEMDQAGLRTLAVSVDDPERRAEVEQFAAEEDLEFPVLLADNAFSSAYNLLKRHLLNLRTDLRIPTSFLVNSDGHVEKIYEGRVTAKQVIADRGLLGEAAGRRLDRAIPFEGRWFTSRPRRNYAELGAAMLQHGLFRAAVPYFESSAATTPDAADSHYNLGTAYLSLGRLGAARTSFERALDRNRNYPEAHNSLGAVVARLGDHNAAVDHFRAAIRARAGYAKAIGNLATAYERLGRQGMAVAALQEGIAARPDDAGLWNRLGTIQARSGRLEEAEDSFRKALRLEPADTEVMTNLALLDAQRGELAEAAGRLKKLLEERPEAEKAYLALARVHSSMGQVAKARETLQRLLQRNPLHREGQRMLEQLGVSK